MCWGYINPYYVLCLNRDAKQGDRQKSPPHYYGRAGDFVDVVSAHLHKLPVVIVRTIRVEPPLLPTYGEPFPCVIDDLSWLEPKDEVELAPVIAPPTRAKTKPTSRTAVKKIIITNQIEMF